MMEGSRTKRTIQNSQMSLLLFLIQVLIGFYSRKVFLDHLGDEVIGLNTTLGNILGFLNLAELGIGIAMATSLYQPIHDQDRHTIREILGVQGFLYKRIALLLCLLSIPIIIALPFIFPSTECGIAYVYVAYIVFLSGSIFGYLWNYRQVLIQADQKNYKLMPWVHGLRYVKILLQIYVLIFFSWGIWGWIIIEFIGNVATVLAINYVMRKEYPWLYAEKTPTSDLIHKYHGLIVKTKQVFVHKIALFVIEQTAPLIIYAFVSLTMVTFYGNYMILIGYVVTLMNVVFEGMGASIGNLVAEKNRAHTLDVFWELFTSRIWIAGIACYGLYLFIGPFITLWIGSRYLLGETTLLLLVTTMFIRITRSVVDSFKNAYQLFADVWAPIAEAAIHLGGAILLGYFWGLNGILLGGILSQIIIVLIWKPYYTFRKGLGASPLSYYLQFIVHCAVLFVFACLAKALYQHFYVWQDGSDWLMLVVWLTVSLLFFIVTTFITLYILTTGMRMFARRMIRITTHKL